MISRYPRMQRAMYGVTLVRRLHGFELRTTCLLRTLTTINYQYLIIIIFVGYFLLLKSI